MSAPRSKSVPASRTLERSSGNDEEDSSGVSAFPVLQPELPNAVPTWIQELANARAGRHSRASSVVSTRTRFSTTTFDDARSIDIQAGGQTFRISRYGDRITDTSAPPPYPGPSDDDLFVRRLDDMRPEEQGLDLDEDEEHFHRRHHRHGGPGRRRHPRRVRIAMPNDEASIHPNDDDSMAVDTPSRVLSDEELRQIILDLPARLKTALGIDPEQKQLEDPGIYYLDSMDSHQAESHRSDLSPVTSSAEPPVEDRSINYGQVRGILRNAPHNAPYHIDSGPSEQRGKAKPSSEHSIAQKLWNTYQNAKLPRSPTLDTDHDDNVFTEPFKTMQPPGETATLPTVGDLNELSQVYNRVIRDLDREHRKQLHERDKELAQLRILLHEKDIVYRQQLKAKDFVIEDLKQRQDRLEENIELQIERAAHQVEDLWETRWKEHSVQLMEKCGLIKPALHTYAETATQTDE